MTTKTQFLTFLAFFATSGFSAPQKIAKKIKPVEVQTLAPNDNVVVKSSTRIDFSETAIDGQMKAPEGFFLNGHGANSMNQLVKLRSNFRNELRNSRSAVKSHVR